MKLIAHRGIVNKEIKENTLSAFSAAEKNPQYVGFELDLRETKDQKLIVYHDVLYKGKLIKNYHFKELKGIVLLETVLKQNYQKIILMEIKDFSLDLKKLAKLLKKYSFLNIYLFSFNNKVIKELKKTDLKVKYGILNYLFNSEEKYDYDFIALINKTITTNIISYFKTKQIQIFSYGVFSVKDIVNPDIYYIVDHKLTNKLD